MGHAGAIISGGTGTAAEKIKAFQAVGVPVAKTPGEVAALVEQKMKASTSKSAAKPAKKAAAKKPAKKAAPKKAAKKPAKKTAAKKVKAVIKKVKVLKAAKSKSSPKAKARKK